MKKIGIILMVLFSAVCSIGYAAERYALSNMGDKSLFCVRFTETASGVRVESSFEIRPGGPRYSSVDLNHEMVRCGTMRDCQNASQNLAAIEAACPIAVSKSRCNPDQDGGMLCEIE